MAEEVKKIITIETSKAATSIRDLMTQMEDLSKKAESLDKNTQEYEDTLKELKSTSDKVSSTLGEQGVKFSELTNYVNNYGTKYEDVFKKTLAATAEQTTGLKGVGSVLSSLPELFKTLKTSGVGSFTAIRTAIASTGLGLIPIVLGTIIANFDTLKGVAQKIFPVLRDQTKEYQEQVRLSNELINKANDRFGYEKRLAQAMGKSTEYMLKLELNQQGQLVRMYKSQEAAARAAGGETLKTWEKNITAARQGYQLADESLKTYYRNEKERQQESIKTTRTTVQTNVKSVKDAVDDTNKELDTLIKKIDNYWLTDLEKLKKDQEEALALAGNNEEARFKILEYYQEKERELLSKQAEEKANLAKKEQEDLQQAAESRLNQSLADNQYDYDMGLISYEEFINNKETILQDALNNESDLTLEEQRKINVELHKIDQQRTKQEQEEAEKRKKANLAAASFTVGITSDMFSSIADLMDENSKAAKAMNIMSVIMDTAMGIVKIWAEWGSKFPYGPAIAAVQTATFTAVAAKSIKQITKANKNSSAADLGGAESVQPTSIAATPLLDQSRDEIQMNQMQAATEQPQTDTRVYVVESDITEVQNRVAVTENNARY